MKVRGARIESVEGLEPEINAAIAEALHTCIQETDLDVRLEIVTDRTVGKVRDTYSVAESDKIVIVTTDRQSAFDRILASIPFKGQVLNLTSAWWMQQTRHLAANALLDVPDPNVSIMQRCTVFPVEFVVRGFLTGSTDTSLWTHYKAGEREYCGNTFPDGMKKNDRLAANVVTPTTKAVDHDVPISPAEIVAQGLMSQEDWDSVSSAALALFKFGQEEAAKRGLLLVDTKYEFGKDAAGTIRLVDEIHTPDSSRYWLADTYEARHRAGEEPQNIDKEFLRLWFRENCDPYHDEVLPDAPAELVTELSRRYILLYEKITGQRFQVPDLGTDPKQRMAEAVKKSLERL
ncbi:Phosphoribosylaminoimidazole-succinocarboxamide synthase [Coccomyxa sp. Obi]|nr:Phosphoribosylaminoimidazole-succinocarboxamide synthase [Coccomyxa sp. Obi]